jgi:hypothetical protein
MLRALASAFAAVVLLHASIAAAHAFTLADAVATFALNPEEAVPLLKPFAEAEIVVAQVLLGQAHLADGQVSSCDQATHWLSKAAENGSGEAAYRLGALYEQGHCGTDLPAASMWFLAAASLGHPDAHIKVARAILRVEEDPQPMRALHWLIKSAHAFDPYGCIELGLSFVGRQKADHLEALKWFMVAAVFSEEGSHSYNEALSLRSAAQALISPHHVRVAAVEADEIVEAIFEDPSRHSRSLTKASSR